MEIYKTVKGFNNYQISNLGRVWSVKNKKQLKLSLHSSGYYCVNLYIDGKRQLNKIHQLVAIAFLNHKPCGYKIVVDHIDNNPLNNRVDNLQLVTPRENSSKDRKGSSKYTDVNWHKNRNKWQANIQVNGNLKYLGVFNNELEAHKEYQKALSELG